MSLKKQNTIIKNITSLGLLQLANYVMPIIIVPIIVRILGVEIFGKITYVQNIISYTTIFINFGFDYSATKQIAINKNNQPRINQIFCNVISFKTLFLLASYIFLFAYCFISKSEINYKLLIYTSLINIGYTFFPNWFFQGIEKMEKIAITNFIIKFIGTILIIFTIHKQEDYLLYPLILSLSNIIVSFFLLIYTTQKYNIKLIKNINFQDPSIKNGLPIFINNIFGNLYSVGSITILGFFASSTEIGLYSGIHKIIFAIVMLTSMPISMSLFPHISQQIHLNTKKGFQIYQKYIFYVILFAGGISILSFLFAPFIVKIMLGTEFLNAINIFKLLSIQPLLISLASMLTTVGLYSFNLEKFAPLVGVLVSLSATTIYLILIPKLGMIGAAYGYIFAEIIEIIISSFFILRYKKNNI